MDTNDMLKLMGTLLASGGSDEKKETASNGLDLGDLMGLLGGSSAASTKAATVDTGALTSMLGMLSGSSSSKKSNSLDLGDLMGLLGGDGGLDLGSIAGLLGGTAAAATTAKSSSKSTKKNADNSALLKQGAMLLAGLAAVWAGKGLLTGDKKAVKTTAKAEETKSTKAAAANTISVDDLAKLLQGSATEDGSIDLDGLMTALGGAKTTAKKSTKTETKQQETKAAVDLTDGIGLDDVMGLMGSGSGVNLADGVGLDDVAGLAAGLLGDSKKSGSSKKGGVDLTDGIGLDDVLGLLS